MPAPLRRDFRLAFLVLAAVFPCPLQAQLTTGVVEGSLRDQDGQPRRGANIVITSSLNFRTAVVTNADGEFAVVLAYGEYRFHTEDGADPGINVLVEALQTTHVDLRLDAAGGLHGVVVRATPGVWPRFRQNRELPSATTLPGVLLNEEPASVTEPLDFTGVRDNRVGLVSQRGYSWTDTQYKLLGMDATDSYQPGRPLIVPNIEAVSEVVRGDFGQSASASFGTEVGIFVAQPGASWHVGLATADTSGFLSGSNLPPQADRGIVRQADRFHWFTRDSFEAGGPIAKWADLYVMGTAQWSSQTVPLAAPGNNQHSRLLLGDVR